MKYLSEKTIRFKLTFTHLHIVPISSIFTDLIDLVIGSASTLTTVDGGDYDATLGWVVGQTVRLTVTVSWSRGVSRGF